MRKKIKRRKFRNFLGYFQSFLLIIRLNITFIISGIVALASLVATIVTKASGDQSAIITTITIAASSTTAVSFVFAIIKSVLRQKGLIVHEYNSKELDSIYDKTVKESGYSLLKCQNSRLMYSVEENKFVKENINNIQCSFKKNGKYQIPKDISANAYRIFSEYLAKKKCFFNGKKIRMNMGFEEYIKQNSNKEFKIFPLSKTRYFNSICTNEISNKEFRDSNDTSYCLDGNKLVKCKEENGKPARIYSLSESQCSNHIGVSTLVVTSDDYVIFTMQGSKNLIGSNKYACSASGSADYKDSKSVKKLSDIVINAMNRELCEECNLRKEDIIETKVIGYGRLLDRGGKPEFFGITKIGLKSDDFFANAKKGREIEKELVGNFIKVKNSYKEIKNKIDELNKNNQVTIQLLYYSELLIN